MTDNRTTEQLLRNYVWDLRRLNYAADKPGSKMTLDEYEVEEMRITDEYAQDIAATFESKTCEISVMFLHDTYNLVQFSCEHSVKWLDPELPKFCPECGCKVRKAVNE